MITRNKRIKKSISLEKQEELAKSLYKYRQTHHMSQERLAQLIGASVFSVCRWERGKHCPSQTTIKLMKLLGVL